MSGDLIWMLTRNQSSFLVKRNGIQFSKEHGNLLNINSFKYSGLAQPKTVHVSAADKGVAVTTKKTTAKKIAKNTHSTTIKKSTRSAAKSVRNIVLSYRPDLEKAALARASRLQQKALPSKAKKVRGTRKTATA
ncbi:ribosomal L28e/Mak16 [Gaertneriomyces semiglobifer]|nr:ribosomal L28e/Mak16 [Gaertneriomyces semiglobifer]